jgi:hypothetical protein
MLLDASFGRCRDVLEGTGLMKLGRERLLAISILTCS